MQLPKMVYDGDYSTIKIPPMVWIYGLTSSQIHNMGGNIVVSC